MAAWRSPSNIAIVKYWGKTGNQLPVNPSISMTLSAAYTETRVTAVPDKDSAFCVEFFLDGSPNKAFGSRIESYISGIEQVLPFLNHTRLIIHSSNTFPHSSGIASSASAFSALALCLSELGERICGYKLPDFHTFASHLARLGSGSASRSLYGGFTIWGETSRFPGSSDLFARQVTGIHEIFYGLRDAILLVNKGVKKVSSSAGHSRMNGHPFADARIHQARKNANELIPALQQGDIATFTRITENEALTLHALMMTSSPGFILMEPETIAIINKIIEFREQTGTPVCFTLDAGPNIHLLYFESDRERVQQFFVEYFSKKNKQNVWIDDCIGSGPENISVKTSPEINCI
jgi:diphosphomevalonate decarboxylase